MRHENVIAVSINDSYKGAEKHFGKGMVNINAVYDCARAGWGINLKKHNPNNLKYAIAIYKGKIKGVFEINNVNGWYNQINCVKLNKGDRMEIPPIWRHNMFAGGYLLPVPNAWNFRGMNITNKSIGKNIAKKWLSNYRLYGKTRYMYFP